MTALDAELVRRWFGRLRRTRTPLTPIWGIVPTDQEAAALDEGGAQVEFAVRDLPVPATVVELTEAPALALRDYLGGMAAGISGARRMLAAPSDDTVAWEGAVTWEGVAPSDDAGSFDDVPVTGAGLSDASSRSGPLALAAGLNAGAAALQRGTSRAERNRERGGVREPTAAESATLAGETAAELVADGADLRRIAGSAAGVAISRWQDRMPDDPSASIDYRTRGLVALVLLALEQECGEPPPPAERASCGAMPGENLGRPFLAEITFTMRVAPEELAELATTLSGMSQEVAIWPSAGWPHFHVHTDRPGEVVEHVYASGIPFDLRITHLG